MRIVLEGEYPKRELAVCCKVEVVKGARGERFCSDSFMSFTNQVLFSPRSIIFFTIFSSRGSSLQVNKILLPLFSKSPTMCQNCSDLKARISLSFSIIILKAGD